MTGLETFAGWSALVAAAATVVGAAFLITFFKRGQPWGTWNDVASVVLMVATIPVALVIAAIENRSPFPGLLAWLVATVGIVGMLAAAAFQAALVAGLRTYEQLLGRTLGAGAVVGAWYALAGLLGFGGLGVPLSLLAVASGLGFIAIGYGFAAGAQQHPLSVAGGLVLLVASTAFLGWLGLRLISGDLLVAAGNQ